MDPSEVEVTVDDSQNQQIVDDLRSYLLLVGPALMVPGNTSFTASMEENLLTESTIETMTKFAINAENSVLVLTLIGDKVHLSLDLTVQKSFQDLRSSFAVLKVRDLPLDASRPIPLQIQVMSLLVDVGTEDNNEESRRAIYLQNMHQITRHLLAPLAFSIRAAAQQSQVTIVETVNEEDDHILTLTKRIRELDFALEQCQRGSAIPSVILSVSPIISEKAKLTNTTNIHHLLERYNAAPVDALFQDIKLYASIGDTEAKREEFANDISKPAKLWPAEIMKQTRLVDTPFAGTIEKEITFWKDLDKKLTETKEQMDSAPILLVKLILKRTNRVSEQLLNEAESVLDKSMKVVQVSLSFLRDFPIKELQETNNLHPKLSRTVASCLTHFSKLKHSQYEFGRAIRLLEVFGNVVIQRIITILREKNILHCPLEDLKQYESQFNELIFTWKTNLTTQRSTLKEVAKRRNENFQTLKFDFDLLQQRFEGIIKFREQHEKLISILGKVMTNTNINLSSVASGNSAAGASSGVNEYDFVTELQTAYQYAVRSISDIFDLTTPGTNQWLQSIQQYEHKLEKIEDKITKILSDRLKNAKSADEMFRIFALFNPLFFRPAIRNAVNSFRTVLMKSVREDVKKLQDKFRLRYDETHERITAELRDIPPLSGRIMWARQIENQLNMLMRRIQDVLGVGWESHIEGKQLENVCTDLKSYLDTNTIYEEWLTAQVKTDVTKYSKLKDFLLVVEEDPRNTTKYIKVNFEDKHVVTYKEVKYLEWLLPSMAVAHRTIPSTITTRAMEAYQRYPIATALQSAISIYYQSKQKITPQNSSLLVTHVIAVRELITDAIGGSKRNKWIKWDSKEVSDWIQNLTNKVYSLQERVEDATDKINAIEKYLVDLSNCSYRRDTMESCIANIQKIIDELPMKGLSNVASWVQQLDARIEGILLVKLEKAIHTWSNSFMRDALVQDDVPTSKTSAEQGIDERKDEEIAEVPVLIDLENSILNILQSNQLLYVAPSLEQTRAIWIQSYHKYLTILLSLPRLIAQKFQVFAEVSATSERATFATILPRVSMDILKMPLLLINGKIAFAASYVQEWLQYQRLWDASISTITDSLGNDYSLWQRFLVDMKTARNTIDTMYDERSFGPIIVNHRQAQMKIHLKYDIWQKESQNRFATILSQDIKEYAIKLQEMKTRLETIMLDGQTKDAIAAIGYIMQIQKQMDDIIHNHIVVLKNSEKLLSSQRYVFPSDWLPISNVSSIYQDILTILERRITQMNTQLPYLQNKIQEEDSMINIRVEKFIENWNLLKPIEGTLIPIAALETISLYATQLHKLLEEYTRLKHAKDCLQISYLVDYRLTSSEQEIQDLKEAWSVVVPIHEKLGNISNTLIKEMNSILIRKQLEELLNELKSISNKLRSYACVEHLATMINKYITSYQVILKDLSTNALQDRHWKGLLDKLYIAISALGSMAPASSTTTASTTASSTNATVTASSSGISFKTLTVGMIWNSNILGHRKYLQEIVSIAQGELALESFLEGVKTYWTIQEFSLVLRDQNTIKLIVGWDGLFQSIEDYLLSLASMKQSPYYKNVPEFQEETIYWESKLTQLRVILELWHEIQKKWLYLRNIFKNQDIKVQLPSQFNKFKNIDYEYSSLVKKVSSKPLVLDVLNYDNLLKQLERQEMVISMIQKSLNEYLEKQRMIFPRFYFLNNEDLIEIIGNQQQEYYKICIHLSKMFAGINNLLITMPSAGEQGNAITVPMVKGLVSKEGEQVTLCNPVLLNQGVKEWLLGLQTEMVMTLGELVDQASSKLATIGNVYSSVQDGESNKLVDGKMVQHPLLLWMDQYPIQIMILAMQIYWTQSVEMALHQDTAESIKGGSSKLALKKTLTSLDDKLNTLSLSILYSLSNELRKKCEQLLTEMIHQRDVIRQLVSVQDNITSGKYDFSWLYHLRFYWTSPHGTNPPADLLSPLKSKNSTTILSPPPKSIIPSSEGNSEETKENKAVEEMCQRLRISMSNATFHYGFEYLGITERLVTTPLTDRCYLTLTQALHFRMGGNPFGPAGTGKTESVKMLGTQLGRFVLVFNCDSSFDYAAMGRIFSGLCQVGAWGCFDEFNRLEERILSAVSQQILTIQRGLLNNQVNIDLLGQSCKLSKDVGIFVTLNPGYAGRSNLPDNLKQLFRAVAMSIPDRKMIAQVMLYSQGIITAEELAGKIVLLFILCEEQLSKQSHYDFGLRALKSVLVGAGELKRQSLPTITKGESNKEENNTPEALSLLEMQVLIKSTYDSILPKLIAEDIPLFLSLLSVIFPDCQLPEVSDELFLSTVKQYLKDECLVSNDLWMEKLLQFKQIQDIRHGIILVGKAGTGKTITWKTLLKVLTKLDGYSMQKAEYYIIDPKAISKDELFGYLDANTLEWHDGIFTKILRKLIESAQESNNNAAESGTTTNNLNSPKPKRAWIIFDGDVDPEWAENLNSVLDDNKILTLPSGDRLQLLPNIRIIMEVDQLKYATLATVSRCGMIWFTDQIITKEMMFQRQFQLFQQQLHKSYPVLTPHFQHLLEKYVEILTPYFFTTSSVDGTVVDATAKSIAELLLDFTMTSKHILSMTIDKWIETLFLMLVRGLVQCLDYLENPTNGFGTVIEMSDTHLESYTHKWLFYSFLWSFGSSMAHTERVALCDLIEQCCHVQLPTGKVSAGTKLTLLDYQPNLSDGEWMEWSIQVPKMEIEQNKIASSDVVITTVDTIRHTELLRCWLLSRKPIILCGPPGSGKTMTLTSVLESMPEYIFVSLNFSSGTTPELILKTFMQYCEIVDTPEGLTLQPKKASYRDNQWVIIFCDEINLPSQDQYGTQRVIMFLRQLTEQRGYWHPTDKKWIYLQRIQFVGACNPSSDAGRQELSLRFLRQSSVLLVDYPAEISLKQIYRCFTSALLRNHPNIKHLVDPLNHSMIEVYLQNKNKFTVEVAPQYIYSPRELSRWIRALHEAMESMDVITAEEMVRLWAHEGLRLFQDRLIHDDSKDWCWKLIETVASRQFPGVNVHEALQQPILYSQWITKAYQSMEREVLKTFIQARLKVFYEEELDIPLVLFDDVIDHVLRIDNVLRHPMGHCLLVGESGTGKTVLTRFVAWMNGYSIFTIKAHQNYTIQNFDDDLRALFRRVGIEGEKICFIFDESNALSSGFLERMNALLASGDIPGLFEGDDRIQLLSACRSSASILSQKSSTHTNSSGNGDDAGMLLTNETEDEVYRQFIKLIQKNLHLVFTMNPLSYDFNNSCTTSPALFNRCVVNWFGTWSTHSLIQVAYEFIRVVDVGYANYEVPNQHLPELLLLTKEVLQSEELSLYDSLVTAIVSIHHTVKQAIVKVNKVNTRQHYLSPRDFLDFIAHFTKLQEQKGIALQEQQQHLQHGMTKLQETEKQVFALNEELKQKNFILKQKDAEANEKLTQMISKQNETEAKKLFAEKLTVELEKQNIELNSRKEIVERELSEAEPALLLAKQSVSNIKKTQLDEVRALPKPPNAVRITMEMVNLMISPEGTPLSNDWTEIRKIIRKDDFIFTVVNFDPLSLSNKVIRTIQEQYLSNNDLDANSVDRASKACGPLFVWVQSQIKFATILKKIKPLRDEMIVLQEQLISLETKQKEAVIVVGELERAIVQYKADYATAIRETELIKSEMEVVTSKVTRANALLISLQQEKITWETSLASFDQQMSTLLGDALLSSAFLTYLGIFDYKERKSLISQWKKLFDRLNIAYHGALDIVEYLMKPYDIMTWINDYDLPNDSLCIENMIIYSYYQRFPLIIDPSEQILKFLLKKYSPTATATTTTSGAASSSASMGNQRLVMTSLLDPTFYKTLITSIRFGNILLIQDIEQLSNNPLLFPILNKELHHVHGRTFITLNNEEIDYSPKFQMIFITNNPYIKFSPDLVSRITLINFTITPQSLELQLFNTLLSYEYPSINEQRTRMIKVTNQQQHQLYGLQTKLLTVINEIQGNILDDDSIMSVLTTIQSQSCTIQKEISHTQMLLSQMQSISNYYRVLSQIMSSIYFLLDSLSAISFLYQYSLPSYFLMLSAIFKTVDAPIALDKISISTTHTSNSGGNVLTPQQITHTMSERMKYLLSIFLGELGRNILPGLQQKDQLVFLLRLAQLVIVHKSSVQPHTVYALTHEEMDYLTQGILPTTNTTATATTVTSTVSSTEEKSSLQAQAMKLLTRTGKTISSAVIDALMGMSSLPTCKHLMTSLSMHTEQWIELLSSAHPNGTLISLDMITSMIGLTTTNSNISQERSLLYKAMILRAISCSDGLYSVFEEYLQCIFTEYYSFPWRSYVYQQQNYASLLSTYYHADSKANIPILLCSEAGKGQTISQCIESVGQQVHTTVHSIAMGSNESYGEAEKLVLSAYKQGHWLIIKNIHLCIDWLYTLEKKLFHNLFNTSTSTSTTVTTGTSTSTSTASSHKSHLFRLFLTCEIHDQLPISLLKQSYIIVYETSHGIKSNLLKYAAMIPRARSESPPLERSRVYQLLIWLHAILQERLRYVPLGWSKKYEINDMDFVCSLDMMDEWIGEVMRQHQAVGRSHLDPTVLPWKAIRTLLKESFYGGRIDQPFDQLTLEGFIENIFTANHYAANAVLVKDSQGHALVTLPDSLSHSAFEEWIAALPDSNPPSWIGLPETAEQQLQHQQMQRTLTNLATLQGVSEPLDTTSSSSSSSSMEEEEDEEQMSQTSPDKSVGGSVTGNVPGSQAMSDALQYHDAAIPTLGTVQQTMSSLQGILSSTTFTTTSTSTSSTTTNTKRVSDVLYRLLLRELQHGYEIAHRVHEDLLSLQGYVKGEMKFTNHIRELFHCYRTGNIPGTWTSFVIVPENRKFVAYLTNLTERFQHVLQLTTKFVQQVDSIPTRIPKTIVFSLGQFFHPDAFLMASRQYAAQLNGWKLEELELYVDIATVLPSIEQDMIMNGLYLQGACYDDTKKQLTFSDDMQYHLPESAFKWRPKGIQQSVSLPPQSQWTMIPIYFNENRKHVVYQVWVCTANQNANHLWAQRSVALVLA